MTTRSCFCCVFLLFGLGGALNFNSIALGSGQSKISLGSCEDGDICSTLLGRDDDNLVSADLWGLSHKSSKLTAHCPKSLGMCQSTFRAPAPYLLEANRLASKPSAKWERAFQLHLHKCAGSSMCAAVRHANPEANLSSDCDEHTCYGCRVWYYPGKNNEPLFQNSCQNWVQHTTRFHIPFVEIEPTEQTGNFTWHPGRDLCTDDFAYVVTLRDPIDRLHSHLCQHSIDVSYVFNSSGKTCIGGGDSCSPKVFDNFYIRSLLGPPVSDLPVGGITEAHLERAAAVLEKFDVVVILERPESWKQARHLPVFKGAPIDHISKHTTSNLVARGLPCETRPTKSEFLQIAHMNRMDQLLYRFAVQLSEQRDSEQIVPEL